MSEARALAHSGLAWAAISLAAVGFLLMLSGVASLQQACSGGMVTTLSSLQSLLPAGRRLLQNPEFVPGFPGTVGYLAPVQCHKFFSYPWWITFFNMTVIILLAVGVTTLIARFRGGMVALSAVLLVLLMDTANTFLNFNNIQGLTGTVKARARVLVAGSIISAIAYFLIIAVVGWHDEEAALRPQYDTEAGGKKAQKKPGGGMLGGLMNRFKKQEAGPEEGVGAGTPGSPRILHVPRQPASAAGAPGASPGEAVSGTSPAVVPVSTQAAPAGTGNP